MLTLPAAPQSLRSRVAELVRSAIVAGEMRPGQVYSVPVLAADFGVSGTPVREALLDLAKEGLLEPLRNKGFRVTVLTDDDLDAINRIREMLEIPVLVDVVAAVTPDDLTRLQDVADRIQHAASTGELADYLAADREFHLGMIAVTGNHRLVEIVSSLRSQTRLFGLPPLAARHALDTSALEHQSLLRLVADGDAEGAQQVMRAHLGHVRGAWAGRAEE